MKPITKLMDIKSNPWVIKILLEQTSREGNGTPLQCSCLENPIDGRAWWAAVHGVAEGQTRLSDFTFPFHFQALEKEMATHSSVPAWRIPETGEPGGLPSMGSHRIGHDWSDLAEAAEQTSTLFRGRQQNQVSIMKMPKCLICSQNIWVEKQENVTHVKEKKSVERDEQMILTLELVKPKKAIQ